MTQKVRLLTLWSMAIISALSFFALCAPWYEERTIIHSSRGTTNLIVRVHALYWHLACHGDECGEMTRRGQTATGFHSWDEVCHHCVNQSSRFTLPWVGTTSHLHPPLKSDTLSVLRGRWNDWHHSLLPSCLSLRNSESRRSGQLYSADDNVDRHYSPLLECYWVDCFRSFLFLHQGGRPYRSDIPAISLHYSVRDRHSVSLSRSLAKCPVTHIISGCPVPY